MKSTYKIQKNNLCISCKNYYSKGYATWRVNREGGDKDYYLCMSEECAITYYNQVREQHLISNNWKFLYGSIKMLILNMPVHSFDNIW